MTIELPNGSLLLFKGLDDPERIKSIHGVTDLWLEESSEFTGDDYTQLSLRIRTQIDDLQIFCSFNPISKTNWTFKRWFAENAAEKPFILKTTFRDNRFLPKQYIERLENLINTNPTYYKIYNLGEFCSLDKLVFNNWKVEDFNYRELKGEKLAGLDFGWNDPAAFTASILTEDKIYVYREWYQQGKTNPQIADYLKYMGHSKDRIIADSAEPKSIAEIKQEGIPRIKAADKGKDSIIHGIQKLQQYEIIVHPSCTNLITELENYSWKKDKRSGEYIDEPIDDFNHLIDSMRYSLQATKNKLRVLPKNSL